MKMFSVKIWRRVFVVMATLLAVVFTVYHVADIKMVALKAFLGGTSTKIIKSQGIDEDTEYFGRRFTTSADVEEYMKETCRNLEQEGIVLLRNDSIDGAAALPLAEGSKVSLFGQGSVVFNYSTTGSSNTGTNSYPSLKDALTDLSVNQKLWDFYLSGAASSYRREYSIVKGYSVNEAPWSVYVNSSVTDSFSAYGDAAIFVISRNSGEGRDITTTGSDGLDGSYLSITAQEQEVLKQLTALKKSGTFRKIIVLLNSAVQIQLDFMFPDTEVGKDIEIDAALWVGNVGSTGIYAINDVLVGKVVPSGRLSDTYAKNNFSSPAMASWAKNDKMSFSQQYANASDYPDFSKETQTVYAVYVEGIYVGYRYYETRYFDKVSGAANVGDYDYDSDIAYPFGYGLSYTKFNYSNFKVTEKDDKFIVKVNVMNVGAYKAKEVVQVYLSKPYTDYDKANKVEKSAVELAGFTKVTLESGQDKTVTIEIDKSVLRTYDSYGKGTYIFENGDYYLTVANNAHDAANNVLVSCGKEVSQKSASDAAKSTYKYTVTSITAADGVDDTIFATSAETGNAINNIFDFADINRYEGRGTNSATYVSRSNWTGTWPTEAISLYITEQMVKDIESNKPLTEDNSTMPKYGQDNGLTVAMLRGLPYNDPLWDDLLDQMTYAEQAYLITNGQHNTVGVPSVGKPDTIDENGPNGVTGSLTGVTFPSEGIWASTFNRELLYEAGAALGEDAVNAGITGLYAPGVNLHRTPFGGRAHEYFSEDPFLMGVCSLVETQGMQSRGVWAYVKHYAVNDEETNRAGVAIWLNEQEMRELVLLPFEYSFRPTMGNAHATMTSFNRIGCIWTSASSSLMETVLRDEWGFDGLAITDMASANAQTFMTFVDGIAAGTNLYDGSGSENALDAYKSSAMFANKMRESSHRILYVTTNFSAKMNGISTSDRVVKVMTWWQIAVLVALIAFIVLTAGSACMLAVGYGKKIKSKKGVRTE